MDSINIEIRWQGNFYGRIVVEGVSISLKTEEPALRKELEPFLKYCTEKGIPTLLEPEKMKRGTVTIHEATVFPGQRGFIPALALRLRYYLPGIEVTVVSKDHEVEKIRNLIRHELASLPADQSLQPTIRQIMGTVDKLSLTQAKKVLVMLREKAVE